MTKRIRQVVFWAHLVTAVVGGLVVLVMSVTGVLLTYQRQMTAWADTRGLETAPPAPGAPRLDAEALLARVRGEVKGSPTAVTWHADPDAAAAVAFGRGRTVYVNAYTGAVLGEGSAGMRKFFRVVTDLHRWLGASDERRSLGKAITGASNLGFLFLVVSGLFLWWPRNWKPGAVRNVILFRRGLSGKARDFNWHHVIGFWSAIPLAVVVASATVISYPWATNLVYRLAGEAPPPRGGAGQGGGSSTGAGEAPLSNLALLGARAERQLPGWRSITLQLPVSAEGPVDFNIDTGTGGQPQKRARLSLDGGTGEVVSWEPFASGTPGRRARSILRFAHTGEVAGIAGQTLAGLVSLGAAVLVWTGLALSLRRLLAWRARRGLRAAQAGKTRLLRK